MLTPTLITVKEIFPAKHPWQHTTTSTSNLLHKRVCLGQEARPAVVNQHIEIEAVGGGQLPGACKS